MGLVVISIFSAGIVIGYLIIWALSIPLKKSYPRAVIPFRIMGMILVLIVLTWPILVGKWVHDLKCSNLSGISVNEITDARTEGLFDERIRLGDRISGSHGNLNKNILSLAQGRFSFVEVLSNRYPYVIDHKKFKYRKFYLADIGDEACIKNRKEKFRSIIYSWALGKCLASTFSDNRSSRYRISTSGYHHTDISAKTTIHDDKTGKIISKFRSYAHIDLGGRTGVCPGYADVGYSPHETLMLLSFIDKNKNVYTIEKFKNESDENRERFYGKIDFTKLEYHKVTIKNGVSPWKNKKYKMAEVFVNSKKPVLLHLSSENIMKWKVTASPDSDVPIVVTSGKLSSVSYVGKKRTSSHYLPQLKNSRNNQSRNKRIIEFLSTKPVSEQIFENAGQAFIPITSGPKIIQQQRENMKKTEEAARRKETVNMVTPFKPGSKLEGLMNHGKRVYERSCSACHGVTGEGIPGVFPAIKDSKIVKSDKAKHIDIIVNGKPGTAMAAYKQVLSKDEIDAVVTYQRNAFGNNMDY